MSDEPLPSSAPGRTSPTSPGGVTRAWRPGVAAVLSVFVPGAGQVYKGQAFMGLVWFIGAAAAYGGIFARFEWFALLIRQRPYFSAFEMGLILHAVCLLDAFITNPQRAVDADTTEADDEAERVAGLARAEERGTRIGQAGAKALFQLRKMLRMWI